MFVLSCPPDAAALLGFSGSQADMIGKVWGTENPVASVDDVKSARASWATSPPLLAYRRCIKVFEVRKKNHCLFGIPW